MTFQVAIFAAVAGTLVSFVSSRRRSRSEDQKREQLAARILYQEVSAAIDSLDLALRRDDTRWLVSLSGSRTLAESWYEHSEALLGIGMDHWEVITNAVGAMSSNYEVMPRTSPLGDIKNMLNRRRAQLVDAAEILRVVADAGPSGQQGARTLARPANF